MPDGVFNIFDDLLQRAVGAAQKAGASYADARWGRYRKQYVSCLDDHLDHLADDESMGMAVRVLVDGEWGFSASLAATPAEADRLAASAVEMAKANAKMRGEPVQLAPIKPVAAFWQTAMNVDPLLRVPLQRKVNDLLELNKSALAVKGVRRAASSLNLQSEEKWFFSSEGSRIEQYLVRINPNFVATATDDKGDFESRSSDIPPRGAGYEHLEQSGFFEEGKKIGELAVEGLKAKPVTPGQYDLVIHPNNLWLTIHESVGHPTELDRVLGYEADFAGTSFATTDKLGKFQYGSPMVNIYADRTTPGGLATVGYDDEGVPAKKWDLIRGGRLVGYQTTREQAIWLRQKESTGCSYADHWSSLQFQRMPNISLEPARTETTPEDLMKDIKNGVYIAGRGSWSIDQQRYNFQFGCGSAYEIKNGKLGAPLRSVMYQSNSVDFWKNCDGLTDGRYWEMGGTFYDGKGQPGQVNAVSHGCSHGRFRKVNVLNARREG
ncbi:MAG: hypothetical protein GMKNLPBB_01340 [Myxococcota bacterium]|nr:hypothetical protein [Myxococcota bacterium]